ncbi:unnamed protein product [Penicillium salamii]|nr:unnamed protein product [Penicillium salamii]
MLTCNRSPLGPWPRWWGLFLRPPSPPSHRDVHAGTRGEKAPAPAVRPWWGCRVPPPPRSAPLARPSLTAEYRHPCWPVGTPGPAVLSGQGPANTTFRPYHPASGYRLPPPVSVSGFTDTVIANCSATFIGELPIARHSSLATGFSRGFAESNPSQIKFRGLWTMSAGRPWIIHLRVLVVTGPETPVNLFSPKWINQLSNEELEGIAGEEMGSKRKRQ